MCVVLCYIVYCSCCGFFFQAEDGIRDLVRSRGLGDVYKRQPEHSAEMATQAILGTPLNVFKIVNGWCLIQTPDTVSYTHLTLPTSDLV